MTEGTAFVLRAEGVNFAATLLDTQDISTIRGAGLALLALGNVVAKTLGGTPGVEDVRLIYTGASQAAFSFRARAEGVTSVRDIVAAALAAPHGENQPPLEHLSFVVDVAPGVDVAQGYDAAALAQAEARNHARQFRQWTVALPAFSEGNTGPDELDRTRPAVAGDREKLSISTKARRVHGRKMRQKFYETEVGEAATGLEFADSFEDIVGKPPNDPQLPLSLNAAMAVIYGDGNGFTKIREKLTHEAFAREVTALQSKLLEHSLHWFRRGSGAAATAARFAHDGALRFETLLWGGDDMMFVMPAWLAIAFVEGVFELTRDWKITPPDGGAGVPLQLTHSFGIVICHYKTPIRLARQLAHEIVDSVKEAFGPENPPCDAVGIEVFESLIPPQDSLFAYRGGLYGTAICDLPLNLIFPGKDFARLRREQHEREAILPRSQLYRALRAARAHGHGMASQESADAAQRALDHYFKRVRHISLSDPKRTSWHLPGLARKDGRQRPEGLQLALLAMLWDYLDPFAEQPLPPFLPDRAPP